MCVCVCVEEEHPPQAEAVTHFGLYSNALLNTILPVVASGRCGAEPASFVYHLHLFLCLRLSLLFPPPPPPVFVVAVILCRLIIGPAYLRGRPFANYCSTCSSSSSTCILNLADLQVVINVIRVNACSKSDSAYLPPIPPSLALLKQLALVSATIANSLLESDLIYVLSWYPFAQGELR